MGPLFRNSNHETFCSFRTRLRRHVQVQVQVAPVRAEEPSSLQALQGPVRQVKELHRQQEGLLRPQDRFGPPQGNRPSFRWRLRLMSSDSVRNTEFMMEMLNQFLETQPIL